MSESKTTNQKIARAITIVLALFGVWLALTYSPPIVSEECFMICNNSSLTYINLSYFNDHHEYCACKNQKGMLSYHFNNESLLENETLTVDILLYPQLKSLENTRTT